MALEAVPRVARILRGTSASPRIEVYLDGALTNATAGPTVVVTRADGTVIAGLPAASNVSTGIYEVLLTGALGTGTLDVLTATWSGTWSGQVQTFTSVHEVVGAHLFGEVEVRNFGDKALSDTAAFTSSAIAEARDRITDDFERICGASFIPKYAREIKDADRSNLLQPTSPLSRAGVQGGTGWVGSWVSGSWYWELPIGHRRPSKVVAVTADGIALGSSDLALIVMDPTGRLLRPAPWSLFGRGNITVAYEYGWDRVPPKIKRAAMIKARYDLPAQDVSGRATSFMTDQGQFVRISVPGPMTPTGIPEVDEALADYMEFVFA